MGSVYSVGRYEGSLRAAIVAYKYHGDLRWARPFAGLLHGFLVRHATWFEEYGVICPVPSYTGSGARRPWGHIELMCLEVQRLAGGEWPVEPLVTKVAEVEPMSTKAHLVRRRIGTELGRALAVPDPAAVAGRRALLVDDVCASGETLLTVARTLRATGAEEVAALVLARAEWRQVPRRR